LHILKKIFAVSLVANNTTAFDGNDAPVKAINDFFVMGNEDNGRPELINPHKSSIISWAMIASRLQVVHRPKEFLVMD
jgi:hypothetical protein